jgi:hypothetical protein
LRGRNSNRALGVRETSNIEDKVMKTLLAATAAIALLAGAGAASAQMYQQPMNPPMPPPPMQTYQSMQQPMPPMQQPTYTSGAMGTPSWMTDDGSSSDHPIHNAGDRSGNRLNTEYQNGLTTAPGAGLPAYPGQ